MIGVEEGLDAAVNRMELHIAAVYLLVDELERLPIDERRDTGTAQRAGGMWIADESWSNKTMDFVNEVCIRARAC